MSPSSFDAVSGPTRADAPHRGRGAERRALSLGSMSRRSPCDGGPSPSHLARTDGRLLDEAPRYPRPLPSHGRFVVQSMQVAVPHVPGPNAPQKLTHSARWAGQSGVGPVQSNVAGLVHGCPLPHVQAMRTPAPPQPGSVVVVVVVVMVTHWQVASHSEPASQSWPPGSHSSVPHTNPSPHGWLAPPRTARTKMLLPLLFPATVPSPKLTIHAVVGVGRVVTRPIKRRRRRAEGRADARAADATSGGGHVQDGLQLRPLARWERARPATRWEPPVGMSRDPVPALNPGEKARERRYPSGAVPLLLHWYWLSGSCGSAGARHVVHRGRLLLPHETSLEVRDRPVAVVDEALRGGNAGLSSGAVLVERAANTGTKVILVLAGRRGAETRGDAGSADPSRASIGRRAGIHRHHRVVPSAMGACAQPVLRSH